MLTGVSGPRSLAAAGVGVVRGVLRRTPGVHPAEQLLCNSVEAGSEMIFEAGEPVPRFVFGGVPSFEESKEATAELKEVLERMYLSSPQLEISLPLNTEIVGYGSGVIMKSNTTTTGSEHVHQALRMLAYDFKVQDVVVSLASDQKVFEAVLSNSEVKKYLRAYQTSSDGEANVTQHGESGAGVMRKVRNLKDFIIKMVTTMPSHLPELFGSSSVDSASKVKGSGFVAKLRNLKNSVVEMATNIPKYFQNFYGFSAAETVSGSDHQESTQSSFPEWGTSLTSLAIMVIMIVVFKRV